MTQQEIAQAQDQKLPALAILELFQGMWIARSIYTAAKFGLADLLCEGPKSTRELAQATGTHEPSLYRLLRALASLGIFSEVEQGQFAQTTLSRALRSDIPDSIYHEIILFGEPWKWGPWEELDYSIRTGETAFSHYHGTDLWENLNQHPEAGKTFDLGMTSFSRIVNGPIAKAYDFSSISTLVDVGGGHGSLLMTLLKSYPMMKGILFERPPVIEGAREHIEEGLVWKEVTEVETVA